LTIPPAKQRSIHAWMAAKLHPAGGALGICRSLQRHTVYACVIIDSAGAPLGIYEATRRDTCTYRMRILSTKLKPLKVTIVHRCF
jgi:hypothetical protein